jgi:exodeoxyribonuclease VII large subunit
VAAAIDGFNRLAAGGDPPRPDLIIVARGGGGLEDLWSFNGEAVVRAAAGSAIPLISAVGHETDFTLIDLAADLRAPTPTAAAEIAVPVRSELIANVGDLGGRHAAAMARQIEAGRRALHSAGRALPKAEDLFAIPRRNFDELAGRIGRALAANAQVHRAQFAKAAAQLSIGGLQRLVERAGERLAALSDRKRHFLTRRIERLRAEFDSQAKLLDVVSYRSVLGRGFALVSDADGDPVRSASAVPRGKVLDIEFHDGHVAAVSSGLNPAPRRRRRPPDDGSQGSLL